MEGDGCGASGSLSPPRPAKLPPVRNLRSAVVAALLSLILAGRAAAQADSARSGALVSSREATILGASIGLAGLAYAADPDVRRWAQRDAMQRNDLARGAVRVGDAYGAYLALASGVALWGGGLAFRHQGVATTGLRAVEAITLSGWVTEFVKQVAGRARPRVAPHERDSFVFARGFRDGGDFKSLPSGHVTAAFAFAAAVTSEVSARAPQHARTVAIATYGLGVVTVFDRLHEDAHWLSDVTLGAGIGLVSGLAVSRWHRAHPGSLVDRILLRPVLAPGVDGTTRFGVSLCLP